MLSLFARARGGAPRCGRSASDGAWHDQALLPPERPAGHVNTTDLARGSSRRSARRALQGYNAQAAVNERQIVVAAEDTVDSPDFGHPEPMVDATERELASVGAESPGVVVADAGYWNGRQMEKA